MFPSILHNNPVTSKKKGSVSSFVGWMNLFIHEYIFYSWVNIFIHSLHCFLFLHFICHFLYSLDLATLFISFSIKELNKCILTWIEKRNGSRQKISSKLDQKSPSVLQINPANAPDVLDEGVLPQTGHSVLLTWICLKEDSSNPKLPGV